jgi:hypothetical protein
MSPEDRKAALAIRELVRGMAGSAATTADRERYLQWLRDLEVELGAKTEPEES